MKYNIITMSLMATFCVSSAYAQVNTDYNQLDTVEVIATGTGDSNVDELKVVTRNANLIQDIFRDIPGVYVGGTNGMNQKIYMRGVGDRGLNISIDGAKQGGNVFHHTADLLIDPELIKAVKMDVGASSVVNNSQALGGSVAFETVDAEDLLEDGQNIGARIKTGYSSNNKGYSQSAALYGKPTDNLDLLGYFKHYGYDFGKSGNDKPIGGDGNDINYLFKMNYSFLKNHKLTLSKEYLRYKGLYSVKPEFGTTWAIEKNNLTKDRTYERDTHVIKYSYTPSELLELELSGYQTKHQLVDFLSTGGKQGVETYGTKLDAKSKVQTGDLSHTLRYGIEYYKTENFDTRYPSSNHETVDNISLYVENALKYKNLIVTPGIRYTNHNLDAMTIKNNQFMGTNKHKFDKFTPALALDYKVIDGLDLFASYAKVFKAPDVTESIRIGTENFRTADNIKATTGDSYEIGGSYKFNINQTTDLSFMGKYYKSKYKNLFDDAIGGRNAANVYEVVRQNTGGAKVDGIELLIKANIDNLNLSTSYTKQNVSYQDRVATSDGYLKSYLLGYREPGDKYTFNAEYFFDNADLLLGYNLVYFDSKTTKSANSDNDVNMPGYATSDIYATYIPSSGKFKNLEISAGIYNVFNKAYASHSQRIEQYTGDKNIIDWEPGRNFKLNISYKF